MALLALGNITVAANGDVTKSGECEVVWDLLEANAVLAAAEFQGGVLPTGPQSVPRKKAQANFAMAVANYVHTALTTRATAQISTSAAGLQRMPASTVEDTECKAPSVTKTLPIV